MLEIMQFKELHESVLSPNNQLRAQAEQQLTQFAYSQPEQFVLYSLQLINATENINSSTQVSCVIFLKKTIVLSKTKQSIYSQLSSTTRTTFQNEILTILNRIENQQLVNQISDLIADLAASLYNDTKNTFPDNEKWSDLINHLFDLYKTNRIKSMTAALRILEGLFDQTEDKLQVFAQQFLQLFQAGFANENMEVKTETLKTLISAVINFKPKVTKIYKPLVSNILNLILLIIQQQNEDMLKTAIVKIFDLCSYAPYFVKQKFSQLIEVMKKVRAMDKDENQNLKTESVEALVKVLERYPEISENKKILTEVVELVFQNMIEIEDEVSQEWKCPPDGFNDDLIEDDDQKIIKIQMDSIDKLLSIIGNEKMIPFLSDYITKMLQQNNWKMTHAAIFTISQIGEYIEEDNQLEYLLNILEKNANHPNPRVRYAVCHALGQFADDQAPDFQDVYHEQYFKIILPLLQDQVPRVVAHCLASLTNFLENSVSEQIQPHFKYIYTQIHYHLQNGIAFVKEACLSALSALAEGSPELFEPFYDEVMKLIFQIFAGDKKQEYKYLMGSAIECVTIIAKFWGKEKLAPYEQILITELIRIQTQGISLDGPDPQKSYLLSGWQRICLTVEEDLIPYLPSLMPSLLQMSILPLQKEGDKSQKTSENDESDLAIQVINVLLEYYGVHLTQYLQDIYNLVLLINEKITNMETKTVALGLLPNLIKVAKKIQNQDYKIFAKTIFATLWESFINEKDSSFKSEFCYYLQQVLQKSGEIFTDQELVVVLGNMEQQLQQSEQRRQNILDDLDVEEETQQNIDFNIKCEHSIEDDFKLEIANLFGKIFQSHQQKSLPIFLHVYEQHIIPCVANPTSINVEYALYLIDDSLDHIGQFIDIKILKHFYQILIQFLKSDNFTVKQSCAFGLGLLSKHLGVELSSVFEEMIKALVELMNIQPGEKTPESFETAKENAVSGYGKAMHVFWPNMARDQKKNFFSFWLKYLPLKKDQKEAGEMHNLLVEYLKSDHVLVIGENGENLQDIVRIFSIIYKAKKISNKEINEFIEMFFSTLLSNEQMKQKLTQLNFNEQEKEFISKLLK